MKKINIVFVHHELVFGGAEKALLDLVAMMDRSKFNITVFAQHDTGQWASKFLEVGIPVVYDYSCRGPTMNPVTKMGNIMKKLQTRQAYQRGGEGLLDICCPGADIVVSYSVRENEKLVFAKNAKTVKYIHGDVATNHLYRQEILGAKELLNRYDRIVCVSDTARRSFQALTGRETGVETHFNPLNSDAVSRMAQESVDLPSDVPLMCAVGRLSAEKGFERLIFLHKKLLDQGIAHKLVIVGDGMDREFVKRMVQATQTQDSVILAGYQENPYPYMKQSKFLVSSSYTEGLPVIAMEALCLGIPIVAPVPSVGEAFGEEVCGLITDNDNASLEAGIRRMLTDEAFYAQAKAGAEKRSAFFNGRRMVKEIENLFLELVQEA